MLRVVVGVLVILHGLVHVLYVAHSVRALELQPGLLWPDGSWAVSRLMGVEPARLLAGIACSMAALGFVVGGVGILLAQPWWRSVVAGTAILSTIVFVLFWDGGTQKLDAKGGVAVLINAAILVSLFVLRWPALDP